MSEERWVVTHATESGATRMWWVGGVTADWLMARLEKPLSENATAGCLSFYTRTGRALVWLTPGQSLTVEKSNA